MLKKISVAVTAALMSTSAFAIAPSVAPDIEIFMSGASAQDNGIANLFNDLCVAGTLDTFKDGVVPSPAGKSHSAYYCEVDVNQIADGGTDGAMAQWTAANPGVNPTVLFHKRSAGGSAQGVNPVIDEVAIAAMNINNGNCTETAVGSHLWACRITLAGDTVDVVSDAGVSDVNPEMFVGENVPSGFSPVDATVVASKMTVVPGAGLVFGIPVTEPLYRALQLAQNKTVGLDDEANMPSLSKAEVASIMAGRVKNWNQFKAGPNLNQGLRDYVVSLGGAAPSSNLVNICRRVNGSGTQAQMNAKFLNYPCTAGGTPPSATSSAFTGPVITLNSGSGDVDVCLNTAATNNRWAVGLQATEKNYLVDTNADTIPDSYPLAYRFVKIDGVAPTIENAAKGKYIDWVENTFQWRRAGGTGTPALQLTGDKLDIVSTIAAGAGSATIVRDVMNPKFVYAFGQGGYLALDTNGTNAPSYPFTTSNPVMPYTHTFGGGLDNCRSPVMLDTAGM